MKIEREDIMRNARFAGEVRRYHTWPVLRQQSVGEHTWQVLRLYLTFFSEMPSEIAEYVIWHDAGELITGDPPFPLKANNPLLKAEYDRLEHYAISEMGGRHVLLSDRQKLRVKFCDLYEMYEFGRTEFNLGNNYARPIIVGTVESMDVIGARMPREDFELVLPALKQATAFVRFG